MQNIFDIEDGILVEYHGSDEHVVIPDGVTEIADEVFDGCSSLVSVTLPDTLTVIGGSAFAECSNLSQINIPFGVTSIGDMAFISCTSLRSIVIPDSVTEIDEMAFDGCTSLRSVTLSNSLTVIMPRIFFECTSLESVTIPASVKEIRKFAFSNCTSLSTVIIPDSVTEISEYTFHESPSVTVVCPEGSYAHLYCADSMLPFIFDYQFEAFHGLLPQGFEKLASPFLADEEKPYIFISYSHKDRDEVLPIIRVLYESGWKIWYDEGLTIGDHYDEILEAHVRNCSAFLLFISENSLKSFYCREYEIPWAADAGRPIIKCVLDEDANDDINEGIAIVPAVPAEIEAALEKVDGLAKGENRAAKGISVVVSPGDRDETGSGSFAYCLYSGSSAKTARAIMLEAKNSGCALYDGTENPEASAKRKESSCLIVFLDKAFLSDERLTNMLIEDFQGKKDIAVCQLEDIEDEDLPAQLTGLHKLQWLSYVHGISADMNTKLARHLQKRGCRNEAVLPGFDYKKTPDGIVITRYRGADPKPRIESEYGGIPVIGIAKEAFKNCVQLKEITLPEEIKEIGDGAFEGCAGLTGIKIPGSVTVIQKYTFDNCRNLASVSIPDSITKIGAFAFRNCRSLSSITIPESVTEIAGGTFSYCKSLTRVTIPESVTKLGGAAFEFCDSLQSVTLPGNIPDIMDTMFYECVSLKSITIPKGVRVIYRAAFNGCRSLTSLIIPGTVEAIGERAFGSCDGLRSVQIEHGVNGIGYVAFYECHDMTITAPGTVRIVQESAFAQCRNLTIICPHGSTLWKVCEEHKIGKLIPLN